MGKPKTDRKMNDFRIFCELIAKTMLKVIDFTDVLEVYCRNEKPEKLGIATSVYFDHTLAISPSRNEKPEKLGIATSLTFDTTTHSFSVEKKSPRNWALQPLLTALHLPMFLRRKEKLEVV